ncbi:AsmA family protein [uncultured Roseobacter sp.]|uniref:AsmA family protein n=1 Tax=uncultured Roseobacter sp. TaxID=114847 RepID=UPI0026071192|nr:AsmA family protein [uncultured Roseobacter sp.]
MKKALTAILALILSLVIAIAAALAFAKGNQLRPVVEWAANLASDRDISIGAMTIDRSDPISVTLSGVTVQNTEEAPDPYLLRLEKGQITFRLLELMQSVPRIRRIALNGAQINHAPGITDAGDADVTLPDIAVNHIELDMVRYTHATMSPENEVVSELVLTVQSAEGLFVPGEDARIKGRGAYLAQPFAFALAAEGGALTEEGDLPVTAKLEGAVNGEASLRLLASGGLSPVEFETSGPTIAALSAFVPVPLPETPPFALSGTLNLAGAGFEITDMAGTVGDSDLAGTVHVDLGQELPYVEAALTSSLLDFDDLAFLVGSTPDPAETASEEQRAEARSGPIIPDTRLPADLLRTTNFNVTLQADEVSSPLAQVEAIDATATLSDGRLLINPLRLVVSSGTATGEIALNVREDVPSADIDLTFDAVSLSKFFSGSQFAEEMGGAMSGSLYMLGVGHSPSEILSTARGQGHLILRDGQISALLVEGAGADVAEALGVLIAGDEPIAMSCAGAALAIEDGMVTMRRAQAATSDGLIRAVGQVDLETLSYLAKLEAEAWDFSLLDLNAPVVVTGKAGDVKVSIGQSEGFPLFDQGVGGRISCATLEQGIITE